MTVGASPKSCLTYVPVLHDGVGWVQICVSLLENFPNDIISPTIVVPRALAPISSTVQVKQAIPHPIPYRYALSAVGPILKYLFKRAVATADPRTTVAYFWPNPPIELVEYARTRGLLTVREMINTYTGTAKRILDDAYSRLGLPIHHTITDAVVARESEELALYDHIIAPSPRVDESLIEAGIPPSRILRSSYGWSPTSFVSSATRASGKPFRALFVASICVRKGVPQLLAAWKKSGVGGELVIVGSVEPVLRSLIDSHLKEGNIRLVDFTLDLSRYYKSADVFILPSLEEGDPLVTYEAAGCGLPVIATPMGGANIIKDRVNGLIVRPYDTDGLAEAISLLANSPDFRRRLGAQAARDAQNFTVKRVGAERARLLSNALSNRS